MSDSFFANRRELEAKVANKAAQDEAFRKRLLAIRDLLLPTSVCVSRRMWRSRCWKSPAPTWFFPETRGTERRRLGRGGWWTWR